ncbi:hypothetical protein KAR91_76700 [Candidatus Pacearchaeota archaeon]|nr:hypothetical protein [Candidatus Pacearchaeota archaeon]
MPKDKGNKGMDAIVIDRQTLVEILVSENIITRSQAETAHYKQIKHNKSGGVRLKIGEVLVRLGFCTVTDVDIGLKKQKDACLKESANNVHQENLKIVEDRLQSLDDLLDQLNNITIQARAIKVGNGDV